VPPQDVTTTNWDALAEYTHAQRLASHGDNAGAVFALRNAVSIDSNFALAYARLGDILVAMQQTEEGIEAYTQALSTGSERRLSRRERDRIKGMYAIDTGDFQAADLALRDSITFYEDDPLSWAYRVYPLKMLGHPEDAILSLRKVLELSPHSEFGLGELANTFMLMGKYQEASQAIEQVRLAGYGDLVNELNGHLYFLEGRISDAEKSFLALAQAQKSDLRIKSLPLLARVDAERGEYAEALSHLNQAAEDTETTTRRGSLAAVLLDRAYVREKVNDYGGMLADLNSALVLNPSQPNLIAVSDVLGQSFATAPLGSRASIRRALDELFRMLPQKDVGFNSNLARFRIQAEIELASGNWLSALEIFRKASNLDAPAGSREYLGRALIVAAMHQRDRATVQRMEEEATQAYAAVALRPGFVWHHPMDWPPGFYADQLQSFISVAGRTGIHHAEIESALTELHRLRKTSLPDPTDTPAVTTVHATSTKSLGD
jgi:tetratricopeptide (TPR) repeat protein